MVRLRNSCPKINIKIPQKDSRSCYDQFIMDYTVQVMTINTVPGMRVEGFGKYVPQEGWGGGV